MIDPLTTSVATALAGSATAAVSQGTRTVLKRLTDMIRTRLRGAKVGVATLDEVIGNPGSAEHIRRLAAVLHDQVREDPGFAEELQAMWRQLNTTATANRDNVTNVVSGQVGGPVIQARDVQGGITIGPPRGTHDSDG